MTQVQVTGPNPVYVSPAKQAEALAEALAQLGFSTQVQKSRSFQVHPRVIVHCGPTRHIANVEYIFAAPDPNDGEWWFHRAIPDDPIRTEKIAPLSQVSNAADLIARTLPRFRG
jgi:hypothetical protein